MSENFDERDLMKSRRTLALAALATLALAPAGSDAARPERADSFAVPHVRVFDGLRVIPEATVVVRNGRILAVGRHLDVPPNLPEIDGSGKTLMPGIIDSHGHACERRQLERAAQIPACGPTCCWSRATRPWTSRQPGLCARSGKAAWKSPVRWLPGFRMGVR
jgi:hypothetical protein